VAFGSAIAARERRSRSRAASPACSATARAAGPYHAVVGDTFPPRRLGFVRAEHASRLVLGTPVAVGWPVC
jgi:hypothetical protein